MIYYHGTKATGLTHLIPLNTSDTTLHKQTIYFTDDLAMAALYVLNKPFKWMTYDFCDDGRLIYTEWFEGQLEYFYKGVSGVIYSAEHPSITPTHMQKVFVSDVAVEVNEYKIVPDAYEIICQYERENQLIIRRYETLLGNDLKQIESQVISAIYKEKLLSRNIPKTEFVKMIFPSAWENAMKEGNFESFNQSQS